MRGRQVQCCAWGESASTCSQMATLNAILHIEGARSKLIEANQRQFNGGNVNFELNMNTTTVLENVGVSSDDVREDMQVYTPTRWEDLSFSADQFIAVEAWIKNVFHNAQIDGHPGATGTITDGRRKLLVRVVNDAGLIEDIERGFPVEIRGQLLEEPYVPNRLFLRIPSGARVDRREGQPIPFEQLILINANVHREIRPAVPVVEPVVVPVVQPIVQLIVKPFIDPEAEPEDDDI
ncbi:uncharacterized protein LOC107045207 [Diachasma alloeum]|uniref:uncharacterized protein LOC107045207 n=1 Tax=Diachasma alloeum TaxID=454923 RepID=UPI000738407A|nr:uncharacterized protein LOC107045207 [Diachasma alloeum]XP_015122866.1 uncharacterized protein LOC107045207 [Diachasma alloeum]XP_015122867.1 uncharacterized protein LOC107045207 [Diachasma alloeum]XP_015122868.1 uncharacterized protein LOC107045207 [Diachasma alloeum]